MKNYRLPDVQVVTKTQLHRNFSEDQKLQIVKEAFASGMSIAAYSREVDIAANVLFKCSYPRLRRLSKVSGS